MTFRVQLFFVLAAVLAVAGTAPAAYAAVPDAHAQGDTAITNVSQCPKTAEEIRGITDDAVRMLCNIEFAKAQTERGYGAVTGLLKYVLLAAVVLVIVVLMIRRATGDESDEKNTLEKAKKLLFVLIIATAILWLGDALLGLDSGTNAGGDTPRGTNGDGDDSPTTVTCTTAPYTTNINNVCYVKVGNSECRDGETEHVQTEDGTPVRYCTPTAE